ncbi:MAG: NfeD family protein [Verrucomicrobiales bacterium]
MWEWLSELSLLHQVLFGMGAVGFVIVALQTLLSFFGLDHANVDLGGHDTGLWFLSVRSICAFLGGFGWGTLIVDLQINNLLVAFPIGFLVGTVFMMTVYFLLAFALRLQDQGNLNYQNAVGQTGTVYVSIPPSNEGSGQIEVMFQNRLSTLEAITRGDTKLAPGQKVRVIEVLGSNTLVVEPLS